MPMMRAIGLLWEVTSMISPCCARDNTRERLALSSRIATDISASCKCGHIVSSISLNVFSLRINSVDRQLPSDERSVPLHELGRSTLKGQADGRFAAQLLWPDVSA